MEIGIVRPVSIDDEMRTAYLDYAMSVIVARALPDVRDGLKPVHRRILYAMWDMGIRHSTPYKKRPYRRRGARQDTTRTATPRSTMRWSAWRRLGTCATRWSTARATSAASTATAGGDALHRGAPGRDRRRAAARHR